MNDGNLIDTLVELTTQNVYQEEEQVLLVCGSFFIMEDVRKFFISNYDSEFTDPSFINIR